MIAVEQKNNSLTIEKSQETDQLEKVINNKKKTIDSLLNFTIPKCSNLKIYAYKEAPNAKMKLAKTIQELKLFQVKLASSGMSGNLYYLVHGNSNGKNFLLHELDLISINKVYLAFEDIYKKGTQIDNLYFRFYWKNSLGKEERFKEIAVGKISINSAGKISKSEINCEPTPIKNLYKQNWLPKEEIFKSLPLSIR